MGRPGWYDNYPQKKPQGRFHLPGRKALVWLALALFSLILTGRAIGWSANVAICVVAFVSQFCNLLVWAIFIRALLSWFVISGRNMLTDILWDITEPILGRLRRVIPSLGAFDISPLVAIVILWLVPYIASRAALLLLRIAG